MEIDLLRNTLLATLIVVLAIVVYQWLLRYFKRNETRHIFAYLHPTLRRWPRNEKQVLAIDLTMKGTAVIQLVPAGQVGIVHELFKEDLLPGIHEIEIQPNELATGNYTLIVQLPSQRITRSIELV